MLGRLQRCFLVPGCHRYPSLSLHHDWQSLSSCPVLLIPSTDLFSLCKNGAMFITGVDFVYTE